jgi:hypothetical protein
VAREQGKRGEKKSKDEGGEQKRIDSAKASDRESV